MTALGPGESRGRLDTLVISLGYACPWPPSSCPSNRSRTSRSDTPSAPATCLQLDHIQLPLPGFVLVDERLRHSQLRRHLHLRQARFVAQLPQQGLRDRG